MADFTITVPDAIIPELQDVAQRNGFANPKEMIIARLKSAVLNRRKQVAEESTNVDDINIT